MTKSSKLMFGLLRNYWCHMLFEPPERLTSDSKYHSKNSY
jgi:hypothetical protein